MTLDTTALRDALEDLASSPGETRADCAQALADAVAGYFSGVVPATASVEAAKGVLKTSLEAAFAVRPNAVTQLEAAFSVFGAAVALGMAGWAGVPPAGPVGFAVMVSEGPKTHAAAAQDLADRLHAWAITGSATLIALPNTVTNWT